MSNKQPKSLQKPQIEKAVALKFDKNHIISPTHSSTHTKASPRSSEET